MEKDIHVLLLEDCKQNAALITDLLKEHMPQARCRVAPTRKLYMEALEQYTPDIVLADNSTIDFGAVAALEYTRAILPGMPFIMLTGLGTEELAVDAIRSGADDYILKDRLRRLPAAIQAAITKNRTQKQAQENFQKLAENEEKYRTLIERISDGVFGLDADWCFVFVNKKAEQLFNRPPGSLVGKNIWEEFSEDKVFYDAYHTAMHTQTNAYLKAYSSAMDRWLISYIYPSPTGISVYFGDITEQQKAEMKIREGEAKYRQLVERITDAFIALDENLCFTYLNTKAAELFQRDASSLMGRNIWEEFPDAAGSLTQTSFQRAMREQVYICCTDYDDQLKLWLKNHIYPSPEGLSVFIRDITEERRTTQTMQLMEKEILHQQLEEQKKISRAIIYAQEEERNHIGLELHDNVNQILAATKMFLSKAGKTPDMESLISYPLELIDQSMEVIRALSRDYVRPVKPIDLGEMVGVLLFHLKENTMITTSFECSLEDHQPDDDLKLNLYRIIQEQLGNIVKHACATLVGVIIQCDATSIEIIITDDGKGFDVAEKRKGIGLSNMRNRVEAFNGSMVLESAPGEGTRLIVRVPV